MVEEAACSAIRGCNGTLFHHSSQGKPIGTILVDILLDAC